jgi:hypothetical protein
VPEDGATPGDVAACGGGEVAFGGAATFGREVALSGAVPIGAGVAIGDGSWFGAAPGAACASAVEITWKSSGTQSITLHLPRRGPTLHPAGLPG